MAGSAIRIKKGDAVKVLSGKEKGKTANVSRVLPASRSVVLEGLFSVKKFIRPKKAGEKGQIVQVPRAIQVSKVMLVCKHCGRPARVGYRVDGATKSRICKKCGATI